MMGSQGFVFPFMSFLLVTTHFLISPTLGLTSQVSELGSSFFFFGDGTYDTGNYGRLYPDSQFMHYPYGKTHYQIPTGRPSDGHLIVDFLGTKLYISIFQGLTCQLDDLSGTKLLGAKYLAQGNVITPYLQNSKSQWHFGVSFATIGASIRATDEDLKFSKQIEHFKVVKEYLESTYGHRQTQRLLSKSVYFFSLGIVDFINEGPLTYARLGNASDELLHALAEAIEVIYEAGGRKFAFQNVAPLKNVPNYKLRYEDLTADCEIDANAATPLYNAFLREKIDQWATCFSNGSQWLKDFNYTYLDYYTGIQYLRDSITTNLTDACCGSGLYNGKLTCGIEDKYELCPHPQQYVWFDGAHLTDHLNDLLAIEFWNGEKKYAEPYTIEEFYSGTLDDDEDEDGGDGFKSVAI